MGVDGVHAGLTELGNARRELEEPAAAHWLASLRVQVWQEAPPLVPGPRPPWAGGVCAAAAMARVAGSIQKSSEVMALVNNLTKVPELQRIMVSMSKGQAGVGRLGSNGVCAAWGAEAGV